MTERYTMYADELTRSTVVRPIHVISKHVRREKNIATSDTVIHHESIRLCGAFVFVEIYQSKKLHTKVKKNKKTFKAALIP